MLAGMHWGCEKVLNFKSKYLNKFLSRKIEAFCGAFLRMNDECKCLLKMTTNKGGLYKIFAIFTK